MEVRVSSSEFHHNLSPLRHRYSRFPPVPSLAVITSRPDMPAPIPPVPLLSEEREFYHRCASALETVEKLGLEASLLSAYFLDILEQRAEDLEEARRTGVPIEPTVLSSLVFDDLEPGEQPSLTVTGAGSSDAINKGMKALLLAAQLADAMATVQMKRTKPPVAPGPIPRKLKKPKDKKVDGGGGGQALPTPSPTPAPSSSPHAKAEWRHRYNWGKKLANVMKPEMLALRKKARATGEHGDWTMAAFSGLLPCVTEATRRIDVHRAFYPHFAEGWDPADASKSTCVACCLRTVAFTDATCDGAPRCSLHHCKRPRLDKEKRKAIQLLADEIAEAEVANFEGGQP